MNLVSNVNFFNVLSYFLKLYYLPKGVGGMVVSCEFLIHFLSQLLKLFDPERRGGGWAIGQQRLRRPPVTKGQPCHPTQCNAMPSNAMKCYPMQCNAMSSYAMPSNAMPCHPMQCNAMPSNAMQYHPI